MDVRTTEPERVILAGLSADVFEPAENATETTLDELEALGIQEGDTVRMYGLSFEYYK